MKVFVTGATGFQGSNITEALLNENHEVVTLKREPNNTPSIREGVEVLKGELGDRDSLVNAMKHVNAAVYSFPLIFDMELAKSYTENFIFAAKQENVELIIYNTTFHLSKEETGFLALDMKVVMKKMFDESGLNVITLAPDIYLDNIAAPWSIPVIMEHKIVAYPLASDRKMPWISHADLGKYIVKAISKPELKGQTLPIGGNLITGSEITRAIGLKIDQELNFISVPVNEFEQQLVAGFGELAAKEISNLYRYIAENYDDFIDKDFKRTNELLGIEPQSLDAWVSSINWNLS